VQNPLRRRHFSSNDCPTLFVLVCIRSAKLLVSVLVSGEQMFTSFPFHQERRNKTQMPRNKPAVSEIGNDVDCRAAKPKLNSRGGHAMLAASASCGR
jgi:hypothetical protein